MPREAKPGTHRSFRRSLAAASLCVGLLGCTSQPRQSETETRPASPPPQAKEQRYDLKGKVVSIDTSGKRLTVDHEAIPGFMGAMTMAYPVKDEHLLEKLSPGDQVTAKVVANGGEFWLENIEVANKATQAK